MEPIAYRSHNVQYQIAANALPEIPCNTSNTTYITCNNRVISIISYHQHKRIKESYHIEHMQQ